MDTNGVNQLLTGIGVNVQVAGTLGLVAFTLTDYLKRYLGKTDSAVKAVSLMVSLLLGILYTMLTQDAQTPLKIGLGHGLLLGGGAWATATAAAKVRRRVPDNRGSEPGSGTGDDATPTPETTSPATTDEPQPFPYQAHINALDGAAFAAVAGAVLTRLNQEGKNNG